MKTETLASTFGRTKTRYKYCGKCKRKTGKLLKRQAAKGY
jgi:hypothetical protein